MSLTWGYPPGNYPPETAPDEDPIRSSVYSGLMGFLVSTVKRIAEVSFGVRGFCLNL